MPSSLLFQQLNTLQNNFDLQPLLDVEKFKAFGVPYDRDVLTELNILLEPEDRGYKPIKKFFPDILAAENRPYYLSVPIINRIIILQYFSRSQILACFQR
jgi:hypothetical protein